MVPCVVREPWCGNGSRRTSGSDALFVLIRDVTHTHTHTHTHALEDTSLSNFMLCYIYLFNSMFASLL